MFYSYQWIICNVSFRAQQLFEGQGSSTVYWPYVHLSADWGEPPASLEVTSEQYVESANHFSLFKPELLLQISSYPNFSFFSVGTEPIQ